MTPIVFLNHPAAQCGVWQMGRRYADTLRAHTSRYVVHYDEREGGIEAVSERVRTVGARAVLVNFHPTPTPPELVRRLRELLPGVPVVALMHEIHPSRPQLDPAFTHWLTIDQTFPADGVRTFRSAPPVPRHSPEPLEATQRPEDLVVGTFGYATDGKGYEHVVAACTAEFPGCTLRIHLPYATYGDTRGERARRIGEEYRRQGAAGGIRVEVTHDFLDSDGLVRMLSRHHLNCLLYEQCWGRGISGALEYAVAVRRPLALSASDMFRNVPAEFARWPECSLREALARGAEPVEALYHAWSPERLAADVEAMLDRIQEAA